MTLPTVSRTIEANLVDIFGRRIVPVRVTVDDGRISSVQEVAGEFSTFLLPGFVDAHVHIESSMLVPREFARDGRFSVRSARNCQCAGSVWRRVHA
jgi:adenine deaminase